MSWHSKPVDIIVPTTRTTNAATVADSIDSQSSTATVGDDTYHRVVVAKAVTMAPHAHTLVLMKSSGSGKKDIEPTDVSTNRPSLHVARKIVNVISRKPFYSLLTNMSEKPVYIPKRMIMTHVPDCHAHVIGTNAALSKTDLEIIGALHH